MSTSWVSPHCTLPTAQQPLREAEFDEVLARTVRRSERRGPGRLRLELQPGREVAARVADLVARETECCSFFTFSLTATGGELTLDIGVPDAHVDVLDALDKPARGPAH